jgi:hypothetical protein
MTFGLYKGIALIDNFPKFRNFKKGEYIHSSGVSGVAPFMELGGGLGDILLAVLL